MRRSCVGVKVEIVVILSEAACPDASGASGGKDLLLRTQNDAYFCFAI
jgi:hypothetical protein